tara:strand:- start:3985 stop:4788 length:804 start_codon:yes stop_codon:yes gene_type:complete
VLIASFNSAEFIAGAINSVLSQDYKHYEIVIVDDCSEDDSLDIIKELKSDKIKVFRNKENFGTGYTKRKCVEESSGEIFCFLDSDDELASNALSLMVKCHLENSLCSLVYSNYYDCNSALRIIKKNIRKSAGSSRSHLEVGKISHLVSCKRRFYDKTEGINPALKRAQDHDLYYKMEEVGEIRYINEFLYFYRMHKNSASRGSLDARLLSRLWHFRAMEAAYNRRGLDQSELEYRFLEMVKDAIKKHSYTKVLVRRIREILACALMK